MVEKKPFSSTSFTPSSRALQQQRPTNQPTSTLSFPIFFLLPLRTLFSYLPVLHPRQPPPHTNFQFGHYSFEHKINDDIAARFPSIMLLLLPLLRHISPRSVTTWDGVREDFSRFLFSTPVFSGDYSLSSAMQRDSTSWVLYSFELGMCWCDKIENCRIAMLTWRACFRYCWDAMMENFCEVVSNFMKI